MAIFYGCSNGAKFGLFYYICSALNYLYSVSSYLYSVTAYMYSISSYLSYFTSYMYSVSSYLYSVTFYIYSVSSYFIQSSFLCSVSHTVREDSRHTEGRIKSPLSVCPSICQFYIFLRNGSFVSSDFLHDGR